MTVIYQRQDTPTLRLVHNYNLYTYSYIRFPIYGLPYERLFALLCTVVVVFLPYILLFGTCPGPRLTTLYTLSSLAYPYLFNSE